MKKDKHNVQVFEDWEQKTQLKYGDATIHMRGIALVQTECSCSCTQSGGKGKAC